METHTAPSYICLRESAHQRQEQRRITLRLQEEERQRQIAAGNPITRGRPRRCTQSAAKFTYSIRVTPDEREAIEANARAARLLTSEWMRLASTCGRGRGQERVRIVTLPARIDVESARALTALAHRLALIATILERQEGTALAVSDLRRLGKVYRTAIGRSERILDHIRNIPPVPTYDRTLP